MPKQATNESMDARRKAMLAGNKKYTSSAEYQAAKRQRAAKIAASAPRERWHPEGPCRFVPHTIVMKEPRNKDSQDWLKGAVEYHCTFRVQDPASDHDGKKFLLVSLVGAEREGWDTDPGAETMRQIIETCLPHTAPAEDEAQWLEYLTEICFPEDGEELLLLGNLGNRKRWNSQQKVAVEVPLSDAYSNELYFKSLTLLSGGSAPESKSPPKKRGRGRPRKTAPEPEPEPEPEESTNDNGDDSTEELIIDIPTFNNIDEPLQAKLAELGSKVGINTDESDTWADAFEEVAAMVGVTGEYTKPNELLNVLTKAVDELS